MKRLFFAVSIACIIYTPLRTEGPAQKVKKVEVQKSEFDIFDLLGKDSWLKKECTSKDNVACKRWSQMLFALKHLPCQTRTFTAKKNVNHGRANDRDFQIAAIDASTPFLCDEGLSQYKISGFVDTLVQNSSKKYSLEEIVAEKVALLKLVQELKKQRETRKD